MIPPHRLVRPLVWITDYIGSNLLIDCIIAIYYFFLPVQWRRFTITIVDCYILKFYVIPPRG